MNTRPRTPPLRSDADPARAADYADRLAAATSLTQMKRIHKEYADLCERRTLGQEIGAMIRAPKGSVNAKARNTIGVVLIMFGLFGVAILFWALIAFASVFF